jgi:glutamine--fructose-6-phosphate transaminase (EC 2.6.1.16)
MPGKVRELIRSLEAQPLSGTCGIAHNRWATHGEPNRVNAHPHTDCKKKIALVHNGIIENFFSLKQELRAAGHKFVSQTDTEVIVHLIEDAYRDLPLEEAVRSALLRLKGSFAVAVISEQEPGKNGGCQVRQPAGSRVVR